MTELLLELIIILAGNDKSVDTSKSRDQLVICLKTLKGFKSIVPYYSSWFQEKDEKRGQSTRLEEDIQHHNFGMKLENDRL